MNTSHACRRPIPRAARRDTFARRAAAGFVALAVVVGATHGFAAADESAAESTVAASAAVSSSAEGASAAGASTPRATFAIGADDFLLNGQPFVIRCGEMHFARVPREYWRHRLQMCRAMGLNTICVYLFWNVHEPRPGEFDWQGMADAPEFCRLAQEAGLKVILRPGPYSCAEWDCGGLPWWLLKRPDVRFRSREPYYLERCRQYLREVGRVLAPQQITRGGPILMVQVENEYGHYGHDREYIGALRDELRAAGFEVPLFTCDGPAFLKNDVRDDIFSVVNFGADPAGAFQALRAVRPSGPLMCGEYYPAWFDSWGKPHHVGDTKTVVDGLAYMLDRDASFSIYMVHGGTTFGLRSGANCPPYVPQISSYDYDAPISEAGWTTPKFDAMRDLMSKHLQPGEELPDPPARLPVIEVPAFELHEVAPLLANLPAAVESRDIRPMESFDQGYGCILYRTTLPPGKGESLRLTELHDWARVYVDGKLAATCDRRHDATPVIALPDRTQPAQLDLWVEAMGRVNSEAFLHDRKGITEKVELLGAAGPQTLEHWRVYRLPLDAAMLGELRYAPSSEVASTPATGADAAPAFYRGVFHIERPGDTFLDMRSWGKGVAWVNGHCLGRYWRIGPTQTMYVPGCWLKPGENEIVVLALLPPERAVAAGLARPILDELHPEADTVRAAASAAP